MNSFRLYLNKQLLVETGGDPANPPVTIEELDATQDPIWKFDDRDFIERIGFMPATVHNWSAPFDGQWADDEGNPTATYENNVRTLEWFRSYAEKYDPDRVAAFTQSMTSNVNSTWPFLTNRLGFAADGMWRLVDLQTYAPDVQYDIIDFPYPEGYGKEQACWINGNFNVIPTQSKHPDEAWEFIKWLTGYGNEETVADLLIEGGWIPTSQKITDQPRYQAFMDEIPQRRGYVDLFNSPNTQITPLLPAQQYYWDRLAAAEERVLRLTKSPKDALETVQDEVTRELSKVIKE
jgi:multiple sugar transport system substrate-binding protein